MNNNTSYARNVFRRADLANILDAIEAANMEYGECLDVVRVALGIQTNYEKRTGLVADGIVLRMEVEP